MDREPEAEAEAGDRLVIAFEDEPAHHHLITLSVGQHDLVNGILSAAEPAGKALRHAVSEDEVQLMRNGKPRTATVLEIQKAQVTV